MNKEEIRKMIPHGYHKLIAQRAGVSETSVSAFLHDKTSHSLKIETATLEILGELAEKRNALMSRLVAK
jgi:DNA-binding LacI/PurR family transcriptional regulator